MNMSEARARREAVARYSAAAVVLGGALYVGLLLIGCLGALSMLAKVVQ